MNIERKSCHIENYWFEELWVDFVGPLPIYILSLMKHGSKLQLKSALEWYSYFRLSLLEIYDLFGESFILQMYKGKIYRFLPFCLWACIW